MLQLGQPVAAVHSHNCLQLPVHGCKAVMTFLLQVQKSYRTVVGGRLEGRGFVDIPLDGKPSLTEYRCISQTQSGNHGWISTLDLCPHTGVTCACTASRLLVMASNSCAIHAWTSCCCCSQGTSLSVHVLVQGAAPSAPNLQSSCIRAI